MWTPNSWYRDAREEAEENPHFVRDHSNLILKTVVTGMPELSRDQVVQRLIAFNRERLDAVPDLKRCPELRGMRELIEASWRGTRDGAHLDDAQIAAWAGAMPYYHRFVANRTRANHRANCSYIYFAKSEAGPLLANNLDSTPEETFTAPKWPALNEHLLIGCVSSGVFGDEMSPELFPAPVWKLVARYCRNADEAAEMLERYNLFWGPCNAIVVDRDHRIAMIEKTACRIGIRKGVGFGFITAMTQLHPDMQKYVRERRAQSIVDRKLPTPCVDSVYWEMQDNRAKLMNELLEDAKKNPSVETLRRFIQFRDPNRGNVAGNGEIMFDGKTPLEHTLKTTIWKLRDGAALWWARDKDRGTPSWENRMPDVQFNGVWKWE